MEQQSNFSKCSYPFNCIPMSAAIISMNKIVGNDARIQSYTIQKASYTLHQQILQKDCGLAKDWHPGLAPTESHTLARVKRASKSSTIDIPVSGTEMQTST